MSEDVLLKVNNLKKWFPIRAGLLTSILFGEKEFIKAVDGVDFEIKEGEVFCLVGESGCGKTTVARLIARLIPPTDGEVYYQGINIFELNSKDFRRYRREIQMIFQDPYESLDPRMRIYDILLEPIKIHKLRLSPNEVKEKITKVIEDVRLIPREYMWKFPHELSGGERQRIAIARALILKPRFLIADEPTSMLDASIRVSILNILLELKEEYNLTLLYITHDLAQARYIGDRLAVMYLGKIVEIGRIGDVINNPSHPYTKALISNVPIPDPSVKKERIKIKGEIPSPVNVPKGCRFHPRCTYYIKGVCDTQEPKLQEIGKDHLVACYLYQ